MISVFTYNLLVENIVQYLPQYALQTYPDLGSTNTGIILCVLQLAALITSPIVGYYMDKIGKKNAILIGLVMTIIVAIGFSLL
jgi:MFS family permease